MIEVVTRQVDNPETGETDQEVDSWEAPQVTFIVEPSGALVVLKTPTEVWAAYAPASWLKVRDVESAG